MTVSVTFAPAAIDGKVAGEKLKAADPALVILVMFSGALPVFDIVTVLDAVVLTVTLLNVSDEGDTPRTGADWVVILVPLAVTEPLPPLLVMLMVAVLAPAVAGLKATVKVWLPPAAIVNGVTGAVRTKSVVLPLVMLLTVRAALPVFDNVTV